ncbi:hypothetical protein ACHAXT_001484 [Thalassiosira profunda]
MAPLLPAALFTAGWYWSSSINAVATQKLLRGLLASNDHELEAASVPSLALLLTTLQLVAGSVICIPFVYLRKRSGQHQMDNSSGITKAQMMIGLLHCVGCLCTNIGFGYGSASLVQVIKLLEPIETLILAALAHIILTRRSTGGSGVEGIGKILSCNKISGTLVIVFGTSALLFQKSMKANPTSIMFAIGSGFCMASRNVLKKSSKKHEHVDEEQAAAADPPAKQSTTAQQSFGEAFLGGMQNFASITLMSAVPAIFVTALSLASHSLPPKTALSIVFHHPPDPNLLRAVLFHCLYNMFSISVLSLTSAPVHSLLNVGKRIANVLTAAFVFSVPLTFGGKIGIVFAAFGAVLYKDDSGSLLFCLKGRGVPKDDGAAETSLLGSVALMLLSQKCRQIGAIVMLIAMVSLFWKLANLIVPIVQDRLGLLAARLLKVALDDTSQLELPCGGDHALVLDNLAVHTLLEAPILIVKVPNATGHAGTDVPAHRSKGNNDTTGHVLAAVIAGTLAHGIGTAVSDAEPLPRAAIGVEVATCGAVEAGIAHDARVRGDESGVRLGKDHDLAASFASPVRRTRMPGRVKAPKDCPALPNMLMLRFPSRPVLPYFRAMSPASMAQVLRSVFLMLKLTAVSPSFFTMAALTSGWSQISRSRSELKLLTWTTSPLSPPPSAGVARRKARSDLLSGMLPKKPPSDTPFVLAIRASWASSSLSRSARPMRSSNLE